MEIVNIGGFGENERNAAIVNAMINCTEKWSACYQDVKEEIAKKS